VTLTYAELFAGAGGLSMGLEAAGFHCVAHAEIEPHARAVLRKHWPDCRLDGDVTQINGADYRGITLLSGGSPCQDLSVAGKRAGLTGSRSSLFHEQCRIWRESEAPYFLWENVHGAFSSNGGKDFATVLSTLVGATISVPADGWASGGVAAGRDAVAAWRVLDLQHFGPPQRRVRVFVLAARTGAHDPAEILALSEGVCGHPSPREQAREGATAGVIGRFEGGSVGTLGTRPQRSVPEEAASGHVVATGNVLAFHHTQDPISGDVSPAIGRTTDGMGVMAFAVRGREGGGMAEVSEVSPSLRTPGGGSSHAHVICTTGHVTHSLTHEGADASEDGTGRGTPIVVGNNGMESWHERDTAITLSARDAKGANNDVVGTLDFGGHGGSYNGQDAYQGRIRAEAGRPRRLTPKECERLMSWPDDHTRTGIDEKGREYELSDTARYRLCGNGVGSVQVQWIAQRLAQAVAG
jgi:DNA (cytosine-5)-methyltransferase 1